jgi:NADP-dependent 3-hydroxy acid dehydrogenase YdfG
MGERTRTAVVTGASSGIGEATARRLAAEGFAVVVGARRIGRLEGIADAIGARALPLDVTVPDSVQEFCDEVPECDVLVNNAGGAFGLDLIAQADDERWQGMFDVNVMGAMRMTRALLPKLLAGGDGHVVLIGSVASTDTYIGGGGYNAAKFAARAFREVLRKELLGEPVRVTQVDPGLVETEFSMVRLGGDAEAVRRVYEGMTPLEAGDVADCVAWAVTRPPHVNIDEIKVLARDQSTATTVFRRTIS